MGWSRLGGSRGRRRGSCEFIFISIPSFVIHASPSHHILPRPPNPQTSAHYTQREGNHTNTPPSDDGTADSPSSSSKPPHHHPSTTTGHKLGPKANQGAINAGLRALDRSGAPCRKWARGGFAIKSFTGTTWEIPRWRAPPKMALAGVNGSGSGNGSGQGGKGEASGSGVSGSAKGNGGAGDGGSSGKENKETRSLLESEKGGGGDVEMSSPGVQDSSPAPRVAIAV